MSLRSSHSFKNNGFVIQNSEMTMLTGNSNAFVLYQNTCMFFKILFAYISKRVTMDYQPC